MIFIEILGAFAAICSTVSFAPQAWKIIQTRKTKDISTGMYLFTVTGFAAWTGYGIALGKWPLIAANAICFVLAAFILGMKLLPASKRNTVADKVSRKKR